MNRKTMSSAVWQITRASLALGALVAVLAPAQAEAAGRLKGLKISVTAAIPGIDAANVAVTANTVPVTYTGTGFSSGPFVGIYWGHPLEAGHYGSTFGQLALSSPGSYRGSFSHVFPDSGSYTVSAGSCCAASTVTTGVVSNGNIRAETTVTFPGPHVEICGELSFACRNAEFLLNNPKLGVFLAEYLVNYGPTIAGYVIEDAQSVAEYVVDHGPTFAEYLVEYVTERVVP